MTLGQLNKEIAEKVFNLTVVKNEVPRLGYNFYTIGEPEYFDIQGSMELQNALPDYSGDMNLAYEVVGKLFEDDWKIKIEGSELIPSAFSPEHFLGGFEVTFECKAGARGRVLADADELPVAICKAALKVVELWK